MGNREDLYSLTISSQGVCTAKRDGVTLGTPETDAALNELNAFLGIMTNVAASSPALFSASFAKVINHVKASAGVNSVIVSVNTAKEENGSLTHTFKITAQP